MVLRLAVDCEKPENTVPDEQLFSYFPGELSIYASTNSEITRYKL